MEDLIKKNCDFSNQLELHPDNPYIQKYGISEGYIEKSIKGDRFLLGAVKKGIIAFEDGDYPSLIDRFMDAAVSALNGAYKVYRRDGFSHLDAYERTYASFDFKIRNNNSKMENGKPLFDVDGNIVKPNSYRALDYSPFFRNVKG